MYRSLKETIVLSFKIFLGTIAGAVGLAIVTSFSCALLLGGFGLFGGILKIVGGAILGFAGSAASSFERNNHIQRARYFCIYGAFACVAWELAQPKLMSLMGFYTSPLDFDFYGILSMILFYGPETIWVISLWRRGYKNLEFEAN